MLKLKEGTRMSKGAKLDFRGKIIEPVEAVETEPNEFAGMEPGDIIWVSKNGNGNGNGNGELNKKSQKTEYLPKRVIQKGPGRLHWRDLTYAEAEILLQCKRENLQEPRNRLERRTREQYLRKRRMKLESKLRSIGVKCSLADIYKWRMSL